LQVTTYRHCIRLLSFAALKEAWNRPHAGRTPRMAYILVHNAG